jgi:nucleoside recognition membrane protein YjiH
MKDTIGIMATCSTGPAFFAVAGIALFIFTPVFSWIGYIFWPFMRIAVPANEAITASSGAALGFIEVTLPSLLVAAGEWSIRTRYMMAVIPVTSIVFIASWIPCIMATELPVKFSHLVIIWLERIFLSIILAALLSLILFPAGAV